MTGDGRDWLWHLFNDPMRSNPWSLVALAVIVAAGAVVVIGVGVGADKIRRIMFRRRTETVVSQEDQTEVMAPISAPPSTANREIYEVGVPYSEPAVDGYAGGGYIPGPSESGVHALPESIGSAGIQTVCGRCGGSGIIVRSVSDLLREIAGLVPDGGGDQIVKEFYVRLLDAAPNLASLFPGDLVTAQSGDASSAGFSQRDRLWKALVAMLTMYDPDDRAAMERLDHALGAFGRSHAAFPRPDGSVKGATLQEYAAVQSVLMSVLHDVAGDAWRREHDAAMEEAYDYAAAHMMDEAHIAVISGTFVMPRTVRR